jgi:hypothetical protein
MKKFHMWKFLLADSLLLCKENLWAEAGAERA